MISMHMDSESHIICQARVLPVEVSRLHRVCVEIDDVWMLMGKCGFQNGEVSSIHFGRLKIVRGSTL